MYACLHQPDTRNGRPEALYRLACAFSPAVEITAPDTVVFSIEGLGRLMGPPPQIAAEIARRGAESGITASLAIAASPDYAVLAATHFAGVTLIPPGEEATRVGKIRLEALTIAPELPRILERWGMKTLEDVASLPPIGLSERLGEEGVRLYELATGRARRPLNLAPPATSFTEELELEDPVRELEPLLFLLAWLLNELCRHLRSQSMATNQITTRLRLIGGSTCTRILELPVPQTQNQPLLKLLQLDLEAHPLSDSVIAISLEFNPVKPRISQDGLFLPQAPAPEKLQVTLARIEHLVGEGNAGSPALLDTHRPDAFTIRQFVPAECKSPTKRPFPGRLRLALRLFRPSLPARVRLNGLRPRHVTAPEVAGEVVEMAGPWRVSGDWWTEQRWSREEWDVALSSSGLYRLYCKLPAREWFVEGVYD